MKAFAIPLTNLAFLAEDVTMSCRFAWVTKSVWIKNWEDVSFLSGSQKESLNRESHVPDWEESKHILRFDDRN